MPVAMASPVPLALLGRGIDVAGSHSLVMPGLGPIGVRFRRPEQRPRSIRTPLVMPGLGPGIHEYACGDPDIVEERGIVCLWMSLFPATRGCQGQALA